MRRILTLAALLAAPAVVPTATAFAEDPLPLKPGPNVEMVQGYCNSCHTSNYIIMNSTFLSTAAWKAEVAKMRHVFGSPMDDETEAKIAEYLSTHYGTGK